MSELALAAGTTRIDTGALPTDWKAMQLRDFCSFVQGGRLGLTKQDHYRSSGVPAFSAAGQDGYVDVVEFRDTDAVILSAIGANCGRCFLATGNWTTLANVQVIIPRPSDAIAPFLHYRVNRDDYWPRSGSAQPFIKPSDIRSCWVALPPVPQQAAIAKVLDTLDTAIHETEAIIVKLKAVKQGLLHDLLTRGIDANGELRPPQSEAPHLYKPSPLGWIPKDWDAGTIGSYLDGEQGIKPGPFGSSIKKEAYSESGFKVYGQEQVIAGDQEIGSYFVPLRKFQELQDFAVEVGDVLISLVGTIGKVLVLKEPLELGIINPRLMRLRPDSRIAHPEFVGLLVSSNAFVSQVVANAGGGTMPVINKRIISSIRVPVVPLNEQQDMLKRKNATDQRISCECSALEKLRALKFGVMDDLLTGRVRVTPLLQEAQHA